MDNSQKRSYYQYMKFLNIPKIFQKANLKDFSQSIIDISLNASLITGSVGVGKTHLLFALIDDAVKQSINGLGTFYVNYNGEMKGALPIRYCTIPDLFAKIKNTYKSNNHLDEEDIIEDYSIARNLFLDDFGVHVGTSWEHNILYRILDYRTSNALRTTITSNFSLEQIGEEYGDRLSSRIFSVGAVLELKGEDRRIHQVKLERPVRKSDEDLENEKKEARKVRLQKNRLIELGEG